VDALFSRTELVQAEALRQHIAAQVPGQVDIWDACAEAAQPAPIAPIAPIAWPTPAGVLFDAAELRGQLVIA
jgi:hypothetical protein